MLWSCNFLKNTLGTWSIKSIPDLIMCCIAEFIYPALSCLILFSFAEGRKASSHRQQHRDRRHSEACYGWGPTHIAQSIKLLVLSVGASDVSLDQTHVVITLFVCLLCAKMATFKTAFGQHRFAALCHEILTGSIWHVMFLQWSVIEHWLQLVGFWSIFGALPFKYDSKWLACYMSSACYQTLTWTLGAFQEFDYFCGTGNRASLFKRT